MMCIIYTWEILFWTDQNPESSVFAQHLHQNYKKLKLKHWMGQSSCHMPITLSFASLLLGNLSQVSGLTIWDGLNKVRGQPNRKAQGPLQIKITYAYPYVNVLCTGGTHREASYSQSLKHVHSFIQYTCIHMPCARSTDIVECVYCTEHKHNQNIVSKDCLDKIILMSLF